MCRQQHIHGSDPTSFVSSSPEQAIIKHIAIDWKVDFDLKRVSGHVDLTCTSQQMGSCELTLDSRELKIADVFLVVSDIVQPVPFEILNAQSDPTMGVPVSVRLPPSTKAGENYTVRVCYQTTESSSALQWLAPAQTSSKLYPFMFSQCQAIHARSLLPCQDLCSVKVTYSARVTHPSHLAALMSAVRDQHQPSPDFPNHTVSTFTQSVPIPAYLIAIVCGELEGRPIGPRSTVWAEPAIVDAAASEFVDTERMIQVAESLCGPYRFTVFDLLVLPPSFPYGGMENPCLTFVTPTLLAGDKSQVAVIAHELAHSWSGNLVTNETWEHFWINEGLTVFTETKIVNRLFGPETASIRLQEGWDHLKAYVEQMGPDHDYTRLCPPIKRGQDPDDSFSVVPYEKGASLFWYLQSLVGETEFEAFIIEFFNAFAFGTVSSGQLKDFAIRRFPSLQEVDWTSWFHVPGMPPFKPPVDPTSVKEANDLADLWLTHTGRTVGEAEALAVSSIWPSGKKCVFLNTLLESASKLNPSTMAVMTREYQFLATNCEVRCAFISLMLRSGAIETGSVEAVKLATEQGRMKFTRTMYRELARVDKRLAIDTFQKNKSLYHPICCKMIARDLGV